MNKPLDFELPALRREEIVSLKLRALYEARGYRMFRMGSFEEYDLYMQNKPFLMGEDVVSFTGADGRLMALKPDVTLSIVKNTPPGANRKVYYNENVYRRSRQNGDYREIRQMGLEYIGDSEQAEAEVLGLAAASLLAIGDATLDLSHMEYIAAFLAPLEGTDFWPAAMAALQSKSPHGMRATALEAGLPEEDADKLARLAELSGPFEEMLPEARTLAGENPLAARSLDELEKLFGAIPAQDRAIIRLDFSIHGDTDYYNGLIFRGFVNGTPRPILAGGRYDNLMRRFEKPQGALGFGLYLSALDDAVAEPAPDEDRKCAYLNVALPKGRLGDKVYALFEKAGLSCSELLEKGRKLIFEDRDSRVRYFLVKPTDVHIYVEHGVADIGVVGKDILLESDAPVLELLDLDLGKCRLAVAGRRDFEEDHTRPLRVATKYPNVANGYYAGKSRSVEIIKLSGSIELAPLIGLSDVIVDIVETGSTLRENNLDVLEEIAPSSARLIANTSSYRFKEEKIKALIGRLDEMIH